MDKEVEKVWEEFWKDIVMIDGELDLQQVKCELYDFHEMMGEVTKVYDHVTGGMISKPNTVASAVISECDNLIRKSIKEAFDDALEFLGLDK